MGSDESRSNVSLWGTVIRQYPQTTTSEERGNLKQVLLLTPNALLLVQTGSQRVHREERTGLHPSLMNWCLMSSDVMRHIKDKLWPMPKHGAINLYVHGNQKARWDGQPRTSTSTLTQLLNYDPSFNCRGPINLSANEQFFCWCSNSKHNGENETTQIISEVCFITDHVAYASSNKTKIVWTLFFLLFFLFFILPGVKKKIVSCLRAC